MGDQVAGYCGEMSATLQRVPAALAMRRVQENGRIAVNGTPDGVEIEVIVKSDKKTVVTEYPTNLPRNPKKER